MMDFEDFRSLLIEDRSVRRFDHSKPVSLEKLTELIELVRYCASGRNAQPLKYRLVVDQAELEAVYPALKWAGYYKDWDGPEPAERPTAYIVQCIDTELSPTLLADDGIQLQALTLGARAMGIGSCIIKAFDARAVAGSLGIPLRYKPHYVVALGYPAEVPVLVDMNPGDSFEYFRDKEGRHHVPKRKLKELIL